MMPSLPDYRAYTTDRLIKEVADLRRIFLAMWMTDPLASDVLFEMAEARKELFLRGLEGENRDRVQNTNCR